MLEGEECREATGTNASSFTAKLVSNVSDGDSRRLTFSVVDENIFPKPGQFFGLEVFGPCSSDPLLRRPISVAGWDDTLNHLEFVVRPVGRGTKYLCNLEVDSDIDCLGPLGKPFPLPDEDEDIWIVGGGIGAAPLIYLIDVMASSDFSPVVFLGAAEAEHLIGREQFSAMSSTLHLMTDDGSAGEKGLVTEPVSKYLHDGKIPDVIYCCGPEPMLAEMAELTDSIKVPVYMSLEEFMACGVGACLGCAVPASNGDSYPRYLRVCRDGPVFELGEVQIR